MPLSTLGFFQYIGPSLTLVVAVQVFGEPFTRRQAITFGFIWAALALFSVSSIRASRDARRAPAVTAGV